MKNRRKKLWVSPYQSQLLLRLLGYWLVYQGVVLFGFLMWVILGHGGGELFERVPQLLMIHIPMFVAFLVVAPIIAWDALRFSHRLVGPLVRFRKIMQAAADGEQIPPLQLRRGDFLVEMQDDFNRMVEELQRQGVTVWQHEDILTDTEELAGAAK